MAISLPMPKIEQAKGMSMREPPAIPEDPQAQRTETMHMSKAEPKSVSIPIVLTAAMVITTTVIAAPDILMVQPKGMEME